MNTVLLVSSLMVPIAPHQVFAGQVIKDSNSHVSDQKNLKTLESLHTSNKDLQMYSIDKNGEEVTETGTYDFKEQTYYLTDEIKIHDQIFIKINDENNEIGWIESVALERTNIDLVDRRDEENKVLYIHTNENSQNQDAINDQIEEVDTEEATESEKLKENESEEAGKLSSVISEASDNESEEELSIEIDSTEKETKPETEETSENAKSASAVMSTNSRSKVLEVISTRDISYAAEVTEPWSINTLPWGTDGAKFIASAKDYMGETVTVRQEKVTSRSTYGLISYKGRELGWIDVTGIKKHTIINTKNANYTVEVTKPWSVNTEPWGTTGYKPINSSSTVGNEYVVKKEATTPRSTYVLLTKNNKNVGWIDSTGVEKRLPILSETEVNYSADIVKPWSVNTRPWGTTGAVKVAADGTFLNENVTVNKEIKTPRSTYALISINNKEVGWVDKTALDILTVSKYADVNYSVVITKPWSINSLPWGVEGYRTVKSRAMTDTGYTVVREAKTPRSTYALLEKNGEAVGWIDTTGIKKVSEITSSKKIKYSAIISQPWSINTNPYGTPGAKKVMTAKNIVAEYVTINEEKTTKSGTYAYISLNKKELGWINITGLSKITIDSNSKDYSKIVLEQKKSVLYKASVGAHKVSDSWHYAVDGYLKYSKDDRFKKAIEQAATRMLDYAEKQHPKTALVYYNKMLEGPWLPDYIFKKITIAKEKALQMLDSDYTYQEIINEKNKFVAWELAVQGLVDHPKEQRIADYVTQQAAIWLKEAVSLHKKYQYNSAIQRYNLLINGPTNLYSSENTAEKYKILALNKLIPNHASYKRSFYQNSLEEALNQQMKRAPQTQSGGRWVNASRNQVKYYLNPDNFMSGIDKDADIPVIKGKVNVSALNVRNGSSTNFGVIDQVYKGQEVSVIQEENGWLNVSYTSAGKVETGWVSKPFVDLTIKENADHEFAEAYSPIARISTSVLNVRTGPSTKHSILTQVKKGQRYKLVKEDQGWYQLDLGNGQFGWVSGDYINVSNTMEKDLLQFVKLSGSSGISESKLNEELGKSGVLSGMGSVFMQASQRYNINEIYLLGHAKLETGNGSSSLATGVRVTHVDGKPVTPKVVYNMFGIGAFDSSPLKSGSEYAYKMGWDTVEKSIMGGAEWISRQYVNHPTHGQDTLYKMRWNPLNPGAHQYATDIGWASKQTHTLNTLVEVSQKYNLHLNFDVPVYR